MALSASPTRMQSKVRCLYHKLFPHKCNSSLHCMCRAI